MDNLFLALFFIALVAMVVGLINPSLVKQPSRTRAGLIFGGLSILLFVLFGVTSPSSPENPEVTQPAPESTSAPKSPSDALSESLRSIASTGSFSYRDIQIGDADSDRPKGTKTITAKVNVGSFYNRNSLLRDTGNLSAKLFQTIYASSINAVDAFVYYYAETTDRYGNKKDDVVIVYAIDKTTFGKINWQSFETRNLCDFLKEEERIGGIGSGPACNVLVNIE